MNGPALARSGTAQKYAYALPDKTGPDLHVAYVCCCREVVEGAAGGVRVLELVLAAEVQQHVQPLPRGDDGTDDSRLRWRFAKPIHH